MQSKAKTVDEYLKEVPIDRQAVLERLRKCCLKILKGYSEDMEYGMPCYKKNEQVEVAFASQKNYISLYIAKHDVVKKNKVALKGLEVGKACIKFKKPEQVDFQLVQKLLQETVMSSAVPCG